jgi:hypothetical protein
MAVYLGNLELAVGGGATGTGLPVNTYAPFYASATDNPTGYNSSTGLYEHPNGDVWLKTGKTITDTSNNYPSTTGNTAGHTFTYSGSSFSVSNFISGIGYSKDDLTKIYYISSNTVYEHDLTTGAATGFSFSTSSQTTSASHVTRTGNNYYVTSYGGDYRVYRYNSAGTYSTNFYLGATYYNLKGISANPVGSGFYVSAGKQSNARTVIGLWNGSFTAISSEVDINSVSNAGQVSYYDGILYVGSANSLVYGYSMTSGATGYNLDPTPETGSSDVRSAIVIGNSIYVGRATTIYKYTPTAVRVVGDSTLRTSTDTNQPLFLKIK